jgi:hypothetical protein
MPDPNIRMIHSPSMMSDTLRIIGTGFVCWCGKVSHHVTAIARSQHGHEIHFRHAALTSAARAGANLCLGACLYCLLLALSHIHLASNTNCIPIHAEFQAD